MTKRTVKLLLEAADDLENLKLPKNATFDMTDYGQHEAGPKPKLDNLCGTAACAAGWLSLMPKWRRRGFKSKWDLFEEDSSLSVPAYWALSPETAGNFERMGAEVFGVHELEMDQIFLSTQATREEVIGMFRELAEEYK